MANPFILGIDVGSTSVKCVLIERTTKELIQEHSLKLNAEVTGNPGHHLQSVEIIFGSVQECLLLFEPSQLRSVSRIGICSQMHGIVLWDSRDYFIVNEGKIFIKPKSVSHLFTWQDNRCTPEFLNQLPKPISHINLSSGYGCATLMWLSKHNPSVLENYNTIGTIADLIVSIICKLEVPVTSGQMAASMGYFDCSTNTFNEEIFIDSNVNVKFPKILEPGSIVGRLSFAWCLMNDAEIGVPLGDLQCAVYSCGIGSSQAVLNVSTSLQLAYIMPSSFKPDANDVTMPIQYYPYFNNSYLAVAASLNAGNVISQFVDMLADWMLHFGGSVEKDRIWDTLLKNTSYVRSDLQCLPTLIPERHDPSTKASVSNITSDSLSIGCVWSAINEGIINNLCRMMSKECLHSAGIREIIGTGTVLNTNKILFGLVSSKYKLPIQMKSYCESAYGAALTVIGQHVPDA